MITMVLNFSGLESLDLPEYHTNLVADYILFTLLKMSKKDNDLVKCGFSGNKPS